jgi:hypothetical protein
MMGTQAAGTVTVLLVATKMPGYVMIGPPVVFIILSHMFWEIKEKSAKSKYKKSSRFAAGIIRGVAHTQFETMHRQYFSSFGSKIHYIHIVEWYVHD